MSHIANAVAHLKQQAQDRAELQVTEQVEAAYAKLEAAGWDLDKVAPYPKSFSCSKAQYRQAVALYEFYRGITTYTAPTRRNGEPNIRKACPEAVARRVQQAREMAGASYEAFVAKLEGKVGEHSAAKLVTGGTWSYSILEVTTPAGVQRWKTQMIINCSVLGTLFNQWPTRLVK